MRRLLIGFVVAASAALVPLWALAGNQEVAEQIAASLRDSGQMRGYRIGVKYQEGTAWLRGQVNNQEQMAAAIQIASRTPGVMRVVNNMSVVAGDSAAATPVAASPSRDNRELQQVNGALSAEQFQRPVSRDMRGISAQRSVELAANSPAVPRTTVPAAAAPLPTAVPPVAAAPVAKPAGLVERLATNFTPNAVRQVNATVQEPTLAPPMLAPPAQTNARTSATPVAFAQVPPVPAPAMAPTPAPPMPMAQPDMSVAPAPIGAPVPAPATMPMATGAPMPMATGGPIPMGAAGPIPAGVAPLRYDQPNMPNYAWPSYAPYPNYAALTYPKQHSPTAWPYIGPFYPYPQVPLGWRKVTLEWHDGWWFLDFDDGSAKGPFSGLFRGAKMR